VKGECWSGAVAPRWLVTGSPTRTRPQIGRNGRVSRILEVRKSRPVTHSALPEVVTITLPVEQASLSPMPLWPWGHIALSDEGGEVTASGARFLSAFGADLRPRTRRIFCQPCLGWSERRYHLKGLVGARILHRLLELGWFKRVSGSRALQLTSSGRAGLSEIFQIEINNEGVPSGRLYDAPRLTV
jgi:hypothetical protein